MAGVSRRQRRLRCWANSSRGGRPIEVNRRSPVGAKWRCARRVCLTSCACAVLVRSWHRVMISARECPNYWNRGTSAIIPNRGRETGRISSPANSVRRYPELVAAGRDLHELQRVDGPRALPGCRRPAKIRRSDGSTSTLDRSQFGFSATRNSTSR